MTSEMDMVNKLIKIVIGLILVLVAVGSYLWLGWWQELIVLIKGGLPIVVALIGLVFILLGWSD